MSWLGHAYARWKLGRHSAALARKRWLQVCCINLALTIGCVESTHIFFLKTQDSTLQEKLVFSVYYETVGKRELVVVFLTDKSNFRELLDKRLLLAGRSGSAFTVPAVPNAMELATFPSMCICCTHSAERSWSSNVAWSICRSKKSPAWHMTHATHMRMILYGISNYSCFPRPLLKQCYMSLLWFVLIFSWCRIHFTQLLFTICPFTSRLKFRYVQPPDF